MSSEIKKYEITILGELYSLVSDQSEGNIQSAVCKVDAIIQDIFQKAPHLEPKKAAVLTALKIASMLISCEYELENIKNKGQILLEKIDHELSASLIV